MVAWTFERIFTKGDEYYDALEAAIRAARVSIDIEVYIYASDGIGTRFTRLLCEAARRGVLVRCIVDGIGSSGWEAAFSKECIAAGVNYKVYHRLFSKRFIALNKRTHRKLILIDKQKAFVGSRNLCNEHSEKISGTEAWHDISLEVQGEAFFDLQNAFENSWRGERVRQRFPELVRLNITRRMRRGGVIELRRLLAKATKRVWIISSYFVPPPSLAKAIAAAARRGVDTRLVIPAKSDVFFMPWVTAAFQYGLTRSGVRVYEYQPSILHAKAIMIDDWIVVGSSNFNHRSLLHDLEVDVVLSNPETMKSFVDFMAFTVERSRLTYLTDWETLPLWQTLLGKIMHYFFRAYL